MVERAFGATSRMLEEVKFDVWMFVLLRKILWPISYFRAEQVGSRKAMNLFLLSRFLCD